MTDKTFTIAGITTHARAGVEVTKVRYGNDQIRLVKMLTSHRKIGVSYDLDGRGDGFLDPVRVDLIELPGPVSKIEALEYLRQAPEFQSPGDQFIISGELADRQKRAKSAAKRATLTVAGGKPAVAAKAKTVA